jgi:hypothetical protein
MITYVSTIPAGAVIHMFDGYLYAHTNLKLDVQPGRVTVTVDSGDPGGQRATNLREETSWEFAEEMQRFLLAWFDGAAVGLRPANLPKNAYPVARKGQIEYVTVPED